MRSLLKIGCTVLFGLIAFSAAAEDNKIYDANGNIVETVNSDKRSDYATYDSDGELIRSRDADGKLKEYTVEQDPS